MKQPGIKPLVLLAMLVPMPPLFAAALIGAPEVRFLAGDHGWASCRYEAVVELQAGKRARLQITLQSKEYGRSGVRLEAPRDAHPGTGRTVRLLAPEGAPLLDIRLAGAAEYQDLPHNAVTTALDALTQRRDLILQVSEGSLVAELPATPAFHSHPEFKRQWESCLKDIDGVI